MDAFRAAEVKDPDRRNFGCGCCGIKVNGKARYRNRRRARARLKLATKREIDNG